MYKRQWKWDQRVGSCCVLHSLEIPEKAEIPVRLWILYFVTRPKFITQITPDIDTWDEEASIVQWSKPASQWPQSKPTAQSFHYQTSPSPKPTHSDTHRHTHTHTHTHLALQNNIERVWISRLRDDCGAARGRQHSAAPTHVEKYRGASWSDSSIIDSWAGPSLDAPWDGHGVGHQIRVLISSYRYLEPTLEIDSQDYR